PGISRFSELAKLPENTLEGRPLPWRAPPLAALIRVCKTQDYAEPLARASEHPSDFQKDSFVER
ncbi:MAG: hypothetical protein ACLSDQ_08415, partial [Adlercreutzia equolifaciens]